MPNAKRLLLVGTEDDYPREVIRGVHSYCRLHGSWEYHQERENSPVAAKRIKAAIRHWKADAIIAYVLNPQIEHLVRRCGLPVVNINGSREMHLPTVISDNFAIGKLAAQHFLNNGFRNFAYCGDSAHLVHFHQRCVGFAQTVAAAGFDCSVFTDRFPGKSAFDWVEDYQLYGRWLASLPKPVAVFCNFDLRGQEIALVCQRAGLRVPDDVAIVGAGNHEFYCQMCTPPLSSVDPDLKKIGYEAGRLLDRMLHGAKAPAKSLLIAPRHVVIRQSSDIIALNDPEIAVAVRFIRDHATEGVSVKDLLREVPISRRVLEQRFEKLIGRTPKAEITRVRMERAMTLLRETDWTISAVSQNSGFANREVFAVSFHREMGLPPTEFRHQCQIVSAPERSTFPAPRPAKA